MFKEMRVEAPEQYWREASEQPSYNEWQLEKMLQRWEVGPWDRVWGDDADYFRSWLWIQSATKQVTDQVFRTVARLLVSGVGGALEKAVVRVDGSPGIYIEEGGFYAGYTGNESIFWFWQEHAWKIRTMEMGAEEKIPPFGNVAINRHLKEVDPRWLDTRWIPFIRRFGLDEIPQLTQNLGKTVTWLGPRGNGPRELEAIYLMASCDRRREKYPGEVELFNTYAKAAGIIQPKRGILHPAMMIEGEVDLVTRLGADLFYWRYASLLVDIRLFAGAFVGRLKRQV